MLLWLNMEHLLCRSLLLTSSSFFLLLRLQRVVCPVEASLNGLLWNRSISPNSLLETTINEEVRPGDLEEEDGALQAPPTLLPNTASRRHTLAEVSARFHLCNPPCE